MAAANDPAIEGVKVIDADALTVTPDAVMAADAVILATPANFGYMSGALKHFFDTVFYEVVEQTVSLPFGLIVKGGNDATGAVESVEKLTTGLQWREAQARVVVVGDITDADLAAAAELGGAMAAGLSLGIL